MFEQNRSSCALYLREHLAAGVAVHEGFHRRKADMALETSPWTSQLGVQTCVVAGLGFRFGPESFRVLWSRES